ncbi:MAG TPA: DNA/RNA nuclease SfsA [Epulopiscium sp.]|nr:DNA/RNA nuclease SfsA [Candidatus Epulonipiscium sp.]
MFYQNMLEATFIKRPNRFIAHCMLKGEVVIAHVKNTGRCKELLIEGVRVYLQPNDDPKRKTKYSLISVRKGDRLINIDSQVPNKMIYEALNNGKIRLPGVNAELTYLKGEQTYNKSRFDFYFETKDQKGFIEVKGVTLEEDGVVLFPDAPTERGLKHIYELVEAKKEGYLAYVIFVIQMKDVKYFKPNIKTHKEFGEALGSAKSQGVEILAYDSIVTREGIEISQEVMCKV